MSLKYEEIFYFPLFTDSVSSVKFTRKAFKKCNYILAMRYDIIVNILDYSNVYIPRS